MIERKSNTLYVIGNGFDLCHDLETLPTHFQQFLAKQSVYNEIADAADIFMSINADWSEYEESLSVMDLDELELDRLGSPDYLSDHEYDRDGVIWDMEEFTRTLKSSIDEALREMVETANEKLEHMSPILREFADQRDAILSFNYTSTVEVLYSPPKEVPICHIHGYYGSGDELLFGYKDGEQDIEYRERHFSESELRSLTEEMKRIKQDHSKTDEEKKSLLEEMQEHYELLTAHRDYYIDEQRKRIIELYASFQKKFQMQRLEEFLDGLSDITCVVVMGHSMGDVDSDYMEMIEEKLHPEKWYISQYNNDPNMATLSQYSFFDKHEFFDLRDEYGIAKGDFEALDHSITRDKDVAKNES